MHHKVTPTNPQHPEPLPAHLSTGLRSRNDQGTTRQATHQTPAATFPPVPTTLSLPHTAQQEGALGVPPITLPLHKPLTMQLYSKAVEEHKEVLPRIR